MTPNLTENARTMLVCVVIYVESFAWASEIPDDLVPFQVYEFRSRGIRYRPAGWLDQELSAAERMAYSRATRRLEEQGLIRRINEPYRDRVVYVQPTLSGIQTVLQHDGVLFQVPVIIDGLFQTHWGQRVAEELALSIDNNR